MAIGKYWRWLLAALVFGLLAMVHDQGQATPAPPPGPVVVITLADTVNTVSAEYVERGIAAANRRHAAAVVLELSTPGGLDTAMRGIIQAILASPTPVIGFVAPSGARAASAGFFILESCDLAAMAPDTNTGAAHPVVLGGEQPDKIEAAKMESDAAAYIRTLAGQRGRNVDMAQKAVVDSQSFTEQEALQAHLIDLVAPDLNALLADVNRRELRRPDGAQVTLRVAGAPVELYTMSLRERVLDMDATLAFVLLILGVLLLYLEFSHPGMFVPGVAGIILLTLSLFALSLFPIAWAGAGLLLLAFVLFGLEATFPTHGALAVGGVVAMALGGILLIDSPVPEMRVQWSAALGVATGFGIVSLTLLQLVIRARRTPVLTGQQGLLGEFGVAQSALTPHGTVLVHGELWRALAPHPIPAGAAIRVRAIHGLRLEVDAATPAETSRMQN